MKLVLRFRTGAHEGQVREFTGPRTLVVGRHKSNDIQIYDERISRRHTALRIDPKGVRVKDLGSGNGTHVNGTEIRETVLADGDVLGIGRTEIEVSFVDDGTSDSSSDSGQLCAFCMREVPANQRRAATTYKGRLLCHLCAPKVEVPGFVIVRRVGEGAASIIYEALNEETKQRLALRVLKLRSRRTPQEARALIEQTLKPVLALPEHPNLIRIHRFGEALPYLYWLEDLSPGRSLKDWMEATGKLSPKNVATVGLQVARGLSHAHAHGVVHHDLRAEKVLVMADGKAQLGGLGLAGLGDLLSPGPGSVQPSAALGRYPHLPPEHLKTGRGGDSRADIYMLGATLYHALSGHTPFRAHSPAEWLEKIRNEAPAPIDNLPPGFNDIVLRALAKNPQDRFQQAEEMAAKLVEILRAMLPEA